MYFCWHNCPLSPYPFVSKFFPDIEIFSNSITPGKLWTRSGKNPRYYAIIYSSLPNIVIYSLEKAKISKPAPSGFFSATDFPELFVEFLGSNMLLKLDRSSKPYHCQQILINVLFCCMMTIFLNHTESSFKCRSWRYHPNFLAKHHDWKWLAIVV